MHGAYHVGFVELDTDTTEKMINLYDAGKARSALAARVDILDVDQPKTTRRPGHGLRRLPGAAQEGAGSLFIRCACRRS